MRHVTARAQPACKEESAVTTAVQVNPPDVEKELRPTPPAHRYVYHVEQGVESDRVEAFLRSFAAILEHTNYGPVLETYARGTTHCTRCACTCQIYQATGDPRDIPCYRSELLLRVYRAYFTFGGWMYAQTRGNGVLTEESAA